MTSKIDQVIEALQSVSIPAIRSFGPRLQPELQAPAAAVSLQRSTDSETEISVWVCCPASLGGIVCENAAITAAQALRQLGASCTQELCSFDRSTGLFSCRLLLSWVQTAQALPYQVQIGGTALNSLTGVSVQRKVAPNPIRELGEGITSMRWEDEHWDITIEELLPPGSAIEAVSYGTFQLDILREGSKESYPGCRWISLTRRDTARGIQQTRIARSWQARGIVNG